MFVSKDNIKGGEGCRNCGFIFYYHKQYHFSSKWFNRDQMTYICPCNNFEPLDNLLYLQMKYEEVCYSRYEINKKTG